LILNCRIIGFLITFAVFFDSRILEAILMWIIEVGSVFFEVLIYRVHSKLYHGRYDTLDELEKNLTSTRNILLYSQRALKTTSSSSGRASLPEHSEDDDEDDDDDDDDSASVHSFEGDDDVEAADSERMSKKSNQPMSTSSISVGVESRLSKQSHPPPLSTSSMSSGVESRLTVSKRPHVPRSTSSSSLGMESNHKYREARLLRERRQLRLKQSEDRKKLNYHIGGVMINLFLVSISFILIVVIASSGGLCIKSDERPRIFSMNQLGICNGCSDNIVNGLCEICDAAEVGDYECYYQYL
jgi:hypothetical protein